jgi:uncharacterized membrane protein
MYWDGHMGGWMWLLGLIVLALVIAETCLLFSSRSTGGSTGRTETPEQILKRRYAQGEIDSDTYRRMIEDLRSGPRE